jgi:hypothetical protein
LGIVDHEEWDDYPEREQAAPTPTPDELWDEHVSEQNRSLSLQDIKLS